MSDTAFNSPLVETGKSTTTRYYLSLNLAPVGVWVGTAAQLIILVGAPFLGVLGTEVAARRERTLCVAGRHEVCAALRDVRCIPEWQFVREGPTCHGRRVASWEKLFAP